MNNEVKKFLDDNNLEYKLTSNQYNLKVCPLCGDDRWHFFMSMDDGLWDCKICAESGNLYQLKGKLSGVLEEISSIKKLFADKQELDIALLNEYVDNLKDDKGAYEYLSKIRGFTSKTIEHFKLGVDGDWIVIPHFQDGKLWNLKMRDYKQKEFRRVQGQPSVLFNIDNLDLNKSTLIIVESETDCIAAWQMGIKNVVGLTTGAGSFPPEWIPITLKFKEIYICLNPDPPGQKGAKNLAEKLGINKCHNVLLPEEKDVNEYMLEHTLKEFTELLKESKKFEIKNIKNISTYVKDLDDWLEQEGTLSGLRLPMLAIDSYLNGFKEEDLIILSGDTGVGKTTISLNFLHHFMSDGHKCLVFFLEGKIKYFILRMMSLETGIPHKELKDSPEWENIKERFSNYPLYFYSGAQMELDENKLTNLLKVAAKLYDIEFVLVDNLQKFVRDDADTVQRTSRAVSILKDLAVDLKIPILLITHIRKPEKEKKRVTMHDAKSSSSIYQVADIYLTLWNNKAIKDEEDDMILSIDKNRMGEGGIDIQVVFEKDIAVYRERAGDAEKREKEPTKKKQKEDKKQNGKKQWEEEGFG